MFAGVEGLGREVDGGEGQGSGGLRSCMVEFVVSGEGRDGVRERC